MRQMNSSPEEFRRALVQAFGSAVTDDGSGLLLTTSAARLHFKLEREIPRQIGALQLCFLRVEISVLEGSEAAAQDLLARVDRATQRGGG